MAVNKRHLKKKPDLRYKKGLNKYDVDEVWQSLKQNILQANESACQGCKCPFGKKDCRSLSSPHVERGIKKWSKNLTTMKTRKQKEQARKLVKGGSGGDYDIEFDVKKNKWVVVLGGRVWHSHHIKKSSVNFCDQRFDDDGHWRSRSCTPPFVIRKFDQWSPTEARRRFRNACKSTILLCRYCHTKIHTKNRWDPIPWAERVVIKTKMGNIQTWVHKKAIRFIKNKVKGAVKVSVRKKKKVSSPKKKVKASVRVKVGAKMKLRSGKELDKKKK